MSRAIGKPAISFGPYRLHAAQRLLLEGDKPVRLGSRAFDVLTALVDRAGEVVSKEELIARAWPTTRVDEASLRIQVNALRRALGDGQGDNRYVVNVIGRGYNFVAPIRVEEPLRASPSPTVASAPPHNLPFATTRMIGREEITTRLVAQLSNQRLVTIVGPGGIGKTTIALAVAERMIGLYEHGVWLIDLAPLRDARLVPSVMATVLGVDVRAKDPLPGLVAALRDNRMLLVLDNCEHVIDAAAGLAEAVLSRAPGITILATSREPLGVPGEQVNRLRSLDSPEPSPGLTAREAAAFPAVQLFIERVTAIVEGFALTDANTPLVVAICRRLDGLPLAIEFAAPRVEALGVEGLAAYLDDSLRPLSGALRRTAMPRHRTMQAVVDWSYGLLSEDEQRFFRALGIFAGGCTVEAATAVAMDAATAGADAINRLADLVTKSLVVADVSGVQPRFRLLDTIRAYALDKLGMSGEREAVTRRHAEHYHQLFARAEVEAPARTTDDWLADYAPETDNLRAALDWAFSAEGDARVGVTLTAGSIPLLYGLSLMAECQQRVEQALSVLKSGAQADQRREMHLRTALQATAVYTDGPSIATRGEWEHILAMATELGDIDYQARALCGVWKNLSYRGFPSLSLTFANRVADLAARHGTIAQAFLGDLITGISLHYGGEQIAARTRMEHVLSHCGRNTNAWCPHGSRVDYTIVTRAHLARVLWIQGYPDQALRLTDQALCEAVAEDFLLPLLYVLSEAATAIPLFAGDFGSARRSVEMLQVHAQRSGFRIWRIHGRCFEAMLDAKTGPAGAGLPRFVDALGDLRETGYCVHLMMLLGALAELQGAAGQSAEGLRTVDEALQWCESHDDQWYVAELLRVRSELLMLRADDAQAALYLRAALDSSRRQGAVSWELRAATSFARLLRGQRRPADAIGCLQPIYDRFTEGFGTADLVAAKQLLDELGSAGHC